MSARSESTAGEREAERVTPENRERIVRALALAGIDEREALVDAARDVRDVLAAIRSRFRERQIARERRRAH